MIRGVLERLYRSPASRVLSWGARLVARFQRPFVVYGYVDPGSGLFRKYVRMSSTVTVVDRARLVVGDHVWVWHHTILDASGGLEIGEGCQIGAMVGIFSHSSHDALRALGRSYVDVKAGDRQGYVRRPVRLGPYSFVGSGSVVMPGVTIGRGVVIGPNCLVARDVPDYSVVAGVPARAFADTRDRDAELIREQDFGATYYAPDLLPDIRRRSAASNSCPGP